MIRDCSETFPAAALSVLPPAGGQASPLPVDPTYPQSFEKWKADLVASRGNGICAFKSSGGRSFLPEARAGEEFAFGFGPISDGLCVIY